jgi:hypothetical protein
MKDMTRTGQRIHIPNLDAKFIQERDPDRNWLIERFNENISLLDKFADNLAIASFIHNQPQALKCLGAKSRIIHNAFLA